MERAASDHLTGFGIECGECQQPSSVSEQREPFDRGDKLLATEGGQVAGLAKLGIRERRQDPVDVVQ